MGKYYILFYEGKGYITTSEEYKRIAMENGYQFLGHIYGWNLGNNHFNYIKITKEMKMFAGI